MLSHARTNTHRALLFPVWSSGMTTRGGCVIELHLHLGNPTVATDSSFSLPPVPVWRWFPEGTSRVSPGGAGTGYPATDQGTLHRNLYFAVIIPYYNLILILCLKMQCIFKVKRYLVQGMNHPVVFFFQLSLRGPSGPMGLTGRPGPLVRHSSDLDHHTSRAPATFYLNYTFCLTRHKLHPLLLILTSSLCMLSVFKWLGLWNHCRVAKTDF